MVGERRYVYHSTPYQVYMLTNSFTNMSSTVADTHQIVIVNGKRYTLILNEYGSLAFHTRGTSIERDIYLDLLNKRITINQYIEYVISQGCSFEWFKYHVTTVLPKEFQKQVFINYPEDEEND